MNKNKLLKMTVAIVDLADGTQVDESVIEK